MLTGEEREMRDRMVARAEAMERKVKLEHPPTRDQVLECFRYALTEITLADIEREIDICKVIAGHWFTGEASEPRPRAEEGEDGPG